MTDISEVIRLEDGEAAAFCRRLVENRVGAAYAMTIVFDVNDDVVSLGSDAFPPRLSEGFSRQMNEILSMIYASEGAQS